MGFLVEGHCSTKIFASRRIRWVLLFALSTVSMTMRIFATRRWTILLLTTEIKFLFTRRYQDKCSPWTNFSSRFAFHRTSTNKKQIDGKFLMRKVMFSTSYIGLDQLNQWSVYSSRRMMFLVRPKTSSTARSPWKEKQGRPVMRRRRTRPPGFRAKSVQIGGERENRPIE